jgi:hypothetical protein
VSLEKIRLFVASLDASDGDPALWHVAMTTVNRKEETSADSGTFGERFLILKTLMQILVTTLFPFQRGPSRRTDGRFTEFAESSLSEPSDYHGMLFAGEAILWPTIEKPGYTAEEIRDT